MNDLRKSGSRRLLENELIARLLGQIEAALLHRNLLDRRLIELALLRIVLGENLRLDLAVLVLGKTQKDQPEHRLRILGGLKSRTLTKIIRRLPELLLQFFPLFIRHRSFLFEKFTSPLSRNDVHSSPSLAPPRIT